MSQSMNYIYKHSTSERISSSSMDENNYPTTANSSLSLQSLVDDIPFEFNPKYRIIHLSNIDVEEYDTKPIRDLLSTHIDFQVENQVLLDALEDVKRKKKEIETENFSKTFAKTVTNHHSSDVTSRSTISPFENMLSSPSVLLPSIGTINSDSNLKPIAVQPTTIPTSTIGASNPVQNLSQSSSSRFPSVRDIYWPTINHQQYSVPVQLQVSGPSNPVTYPPININPTDKTTPVAMSLVATTMNPIKTVTKSANNSTNISTNDLANTFDGTLTSDDPFHEAELRSLNDVAELNHLYSTMASTNTIRR